MLRAKTSALVVALCLAAAAPAMAEDILVTQYKADPSGAPYGIALEKGFFKKAGLDVTGIVAGAGGGSSVRNAMATDLGYGDVSRRSRDRGGIDQGQDVKIVSITLALARRPRADRHAEFADQDPAKDLKGKKFGISNPKSLGEMMGVLVMEKAGLKQGDVQMRRARQPGRRAHRAGERRGRRHRHARSSCIAQRGGESKYRVAGRPEGIAAHSLAARHGHRQGDQGIADRSCARSQRRGAKAAKFIYEHTDEAIDILSKVYAPLPPKDVAHHGEGTGGGEVLERGPHRDAAARTHRARR